VDIIGQAFVGQKPYLIIEPQRQSTEEKLKVLTQPVKITHWLHAFMMYQPTYNGRLIACSMPPLWCQFPLSAVTVEDQSALCLICWHCYVMLGCDDKENVLPPLTDDVHTPSSTTAAAAVVAQQSSLVW